MSLYRSVRMLSESELNVARVVGLNATGFVGLGSVCGVEKKKIGGVGPFCVCSRRYRGCV